MMNDLYLGCEKRYEVENYYTLINMVGIMVDRATHNPDYYWISDLFFGDLFVVLVDYIDDTSSLYGLYPNVFKQSGTTADYVDNRSKLLLNKLGVKYGKHMIFSVKEDEYNFSARQLIYEEKSRDFLFRIALKLSETQDRYLALLDSYTALEGKLLDQVKSSSDTEVLRKFNDTPQNDFSGKDYTVDGYLSSVGKDKSETDMASDVMTPIQRLEEIRRHYADIYTEWMNEFKSFFLEEANV